MESRDARDVKRTKTDDLIEGLSKIWYEGCPAHVGPVHAWEVKMSDLLRLIGHSNLLQWLATRTAILYCKIRQP